MNGLNYQCKSRALHVSQDGSHNHGTCLESETIIRRVRVAHAWVSTMAAESMDDGARSSGGKNCNRMQTNSPLEFSTLACPSIKGRIERKSNDSCLFLILV